MSLPLKIAGNTLIQLVGRLIGAGTTFIITLIVARTYGVTGYGEFTKIVTYVSVFYLIVDFGLNAVWLHVPKSNFLPLLITRLLWSFVLVFIALSLLPFLTIRTGTQEGFTPNVIIGIIVLIPTIITQGIFTSCNALFQQALRYDRSVIAASLGSITTLALMYLMSRMSAPIHVLLAGYTIGGVVMVICAGLLGSRYVHASSFRASEFISEGKTLMLRSVPLGLTLILSLIQFKADIFLLTLYRTTEEVGIYGLATKFFEFPLAVPIFVMNAVYPLLVQQSAEKSHAKLVENLRMWLFISAVCIGLICIIAAPLLVLIDDAFKASVLPFRVLSGLLPIFYLSALYVWVLIARKQQWALVWVYTVGMVLNIGLNMVFIPRFGILAAAIVTGISEVVVLFLLYQRIREK